MTFLGDDPLPIRQLDGGHDPHGLQRIRGQHKDLHVPSWEARWMAKWMGGGQNPTGDLGLTIVKLVNSNNCGLWYL